MSEPLFLLAFDLGTTASKTCLYAISDRLTLRASATRPLSLETGADGRAEQNPEEWWKALA